MSKRPHLYYIDALRVLGTLAVFVYHLNEQLLELQEKYGASMAPNAFLPTKAFGIGLGQAAVAVFFVISGFVLMYTMSDTPLDFRRYGKRRILDIFPFFYVAYVLAFMIDRLWGGRLLQVAPLWKLIFTFLGVDGYFSCYPSPFSPNWYLVGEWYLGCLVILYCLFPLIHRLQRRSSLGAVITVVGFPAFVFLVTTMGTPWVDYTGYLAPGLSCFAAGSFLALLLGDEKPDIRFAVVSLVMLVVSSFLGGSLGKALMPVVGVGCFGLFGWFFSTVLGAKNRALVYVSRLSFPFYLMHHVTIYIVTLSATPAVVSLRTEFFLFVCSFSLSCAWGAVVLWIGSWAKTFIRNHLSLFQ